MEDFVEGFLIGSTADASVYQRKRSEYIIEWEQKNREWLVTIKDLTGKGRIRKVKAKYWRLVIYSKDLYVKHRSVFSKIKEIAEKSKDFKRGFIRGLFDAEGSVHTSRYQLRIFFRNKELLKIISQILEDDFDIKSTVVKAVKNKSSEIYALCIYSKREISNFFRKFGSCHPEKIRKMKHLLRSP